MTKPQASIASIAEHMADPEAHPRCVQAVNSGTAVNLDVSAFDVFDVTLTGNATLTLINPPQSGDVHKVEIRVKQDATHGRTATLACKQADGSTGGTIKWAGGAAPTFTSAAATSQDVVEARTYDGGVTWLCTVQAAFA